MLCEEGRKNRRRRVNWCQLLILSRLFVNTRLAAVFPLFLPRIFLLSFLWIFQVIFNKANFVRRIETFTKGIAYNVSRTYKKNPKTPNRPMPTNSTTNPTLNTKSSFKLINFKINISY
jgi:hypothetical protein